MTGDPTKNPHDDASLENSDFRSRQILENLREIIWVVSSDFSRLEYVNPAYEKIWGRSLESLHADPLSWMESIHPDDRETVNGFIEAEKTSTSDGASFPAFRIFRDKGDIRWIRARLFRIRSNYGPGHQKGFIAQDVTRRRFFEVALRESEEKWRSLLENAPDNVLLVDLDGHVLFANRDFIGQAKADLMGKHLLRLLPPRFNRTVQSCLNRVVSLSEAAACDIVSVDVQGRKVFYEIRMSPAMVGGIVVAIAVSAMDITVRFEQEQTLMESEAFHRTLFEESPTGFSIQDFSAIEGPVQLLKDAGIKDLRAYLKANPDEVERLAKLVRLVRVNQATVDLYRAPDASAMVGPLYRVFQKTDHRHFIDQVVAFTSGVDRYEGEARNRDFEGSTLHLIIRKVVINRPGNGLTKILASLVDVTPIKAAEKERAALMLQLQQAQKMEAIGTLAGGVAHDFNNILSIILGNAELSKVDIDPSHPAHHNIQEICTASMRAKEIVQQLLGFSRQREQNLQPTHLMPLVKEGVKFMRATIPANIDMHSELTVTEDVILADATQIHQVMINLLTNASHAMEKTGGSLSVRADNVTLDRRLSAAILSVPAGRYVRIVISDTGQGIPEADRNRIFDPYFTTKTVGKGTGMGLAVVHGIINSYGGGIVLDSTPGVGTAFTIYLPLVDDAADVTLAKDEGPPTGSERVLFVDDEAMIVEIAEKMLARLGYRVRACTDPRTALLLVADEKAAIDLLITDMSMPGMTGDQLVEKIRQRLPSLPVILCTGHRDRVPKDKLTAMGITEILNKPVEMTTLALAVRRTLDRKRSNP